MTSRLYKLDQFVTTHLNKHNQFVTAHLNKHNQFVTAHLNKHNQFVTAHLNKHNQFVTAHLNKHKQFVTAHLNKHSLKFCNNSPWSSPCIRTQVIHTQNTGAVSCHPSRWRLGSHSLSCVDLTVASSPSSSKHWYAQPEIYYIDQGWTIQKQIDIT